MTWDILPAGEDLLPELARLEKDCFSSPWSEKSLLEEIRHPSAFLLAARSCGGLLGYIAVRDICGEAELMRVAASPVCRRLGVGGALLDAALALCAQRGISLINLEVEEDNAPAIALYKKTGFKAVGRRPGYYDGNAAILMTKEF